MSTIYIRNSHRWVCSKILAYFGDTKPLIKKLYPHRIPIRMSGLWMLARRRSMLVGSAVGIEVDVISWLSLDRVPFLTQFSVYTTRSRIDDVSRLARLCLRLLLVSISFRAKHRAVSHKPFQSPHWKSFTLEMICLTLSRRVHGQSNAGINYGTQSKICAGKESRGYLSSRSSIRCILATNCSTTSPVVITLDIRKSRSSKRLSVSNHLLRKSKDPDLVRLSTRSPGREGMPAKIPAVWAGAVAGLPGTRRIFFLLTYPLFLIKKFSNVFFKLFEICTFEICTRDTNPLSSQAWAPLVQIHQCAGAHLPDNQKR